jgi:zinc transporter 1/2/3
MASFEELYRGFMFNIKILFALIILVVTIISGFYPFWKKQQTMVFQSQIGEALAAGVFLGAGLIHMLGDSAAGFNAAHVTYPLAGLLCGATFLFFLLLEHIGKDIYYHHQGSNNNFAILATIMLSIHSFLEGSALGVSGSILMSILIFLAILGHKWAASFALAIQINKSNLSLQTRVLLFTTFALMLPLGVIFGSLSRQYLTNYPLIQPIFTALAAGTFLYLGTLHGLERAVLVKDCCKLQAFSFVIIGFLLMALVAIYT